MEKKHYIKPQIDRITLDAEISLCLESAAPPAGPNEGAMNITPMHFNNNPFNSVQA